MFPGCSTNKEIVKLAIARRAKVARVKLARRSLMQSGQRPERVIPSGGRDADYGPHCEKPDMTKEEFEAAKVQLMSKLEISFQKQMPLEVGTPQPVDGIKLWKGVPATTDNQLCFHDQDNPECRLEDVTGCPVWNTKGTRSYCRI